MQNLISIHSWKSIKKEYIQTFKLGKCFSPFLSPEFIEYTLKYLVFFAILGSRNLLWPKKTAGGVIYAPLLIGKDEISIIGDYTSASYTDFIYTATITAEECKKFIIEISDYYNRDFVFKKIMPHKEIYNGFLLLNSTPCVKIDLGFSFDIYFKSLSKSVRQNYRTAIHRLNREDKKINFHFFVNQKIPTSFKRKMLSLYIKRAKKWDSSNKNIIKIIYKRFFDLMNNSLCKIDNNFCSILCIDNKVSGFMMGVFTNDYNMVTIPRLAIDSKMGVYCPGLLLIINSADYLIKMGCSCLDLSRGKEQYKYRVGGKEYNLLAGIVKPNSK